MMKVTGSDEDIVNNDTDMSHMGVGMYQHELKKLSKIKHW